MTQFFNGRVLIAPQVEVAIDDSAIGPQPPGGNVLAVGILGYSTKGQPDLARLVTTPDEARSTFGQGTLVDGILRAMNAAPGGNGALAVYGVRVNAGTQSTTNLKDSGSANCIGLTTNDYGMISRSEFVTIAAATGAGTNSVPGNAVKVTASNGIQPAIADNLGYNALQVSYALTGGKVQVGTWSGTLTAGYTYVATPITTFQVTASAGFDTHQIAVGQQVVIADSGGGNPVTTTVTASDGAGNLTVSPGDTHTRTTSATLKGTGASLLLTGNTSADTAGYPLANYATLGDLARAATATGTAGNWSVLVPTRFNSSPGATVTVGPTSLPSVLDLGIASQNLTANPIVGGIPFANASYYVTLTGVAQAVVDWLNGLQDPYFVATRQAVGTIPVAPQTVVAMGGDDDGHGGSLVGNTMAVSTADWQNALNALSQVDTPLFTLMTGDATIHALGDVHAQTVSTVGKLERIQLAGGVAGESTSQAIARASTLDSYRTGVVYPGIQDFDSNGNLTTYPPYYAAAQVAGLAAGLGLGSSVTNKTLRVQGLEVRTSGNGGAYTQADYDSLVEGGVIGIQRKPTGGFKVVQGVTTWQEDIKFSKTDVGVRMEVDSVSRSIREGLETLIGVLVGPSLLNAARAIVISKLDTFAQRGTIVGDANNPPYTGVSLSIPQGHADTLLVSFQVSPGIPANYILVTMHVVSFSGVGQ